MLIICEGIDGTGKTTLSNHLASILPGESTVIHHAKPTKHPLLEYEGDVLDSYNLGSGMHQIHDRFHIGETIWPIVFNRKTEYTPEMYYHTQLFLQSRGAVLVLCAEEEEILLDRLTQRGEDALPLDLTTIENVQQDFVSALSGSLLPPYLHVISKPHLLNYEAMIAAAASRELRAARVLHLSGAYVGSLTPHVLLVGEKYGTARRGKEDVRLPFVPWPSASGHFLMKTIMDAKPSFGIVNSFIDDRPEPLWELWMQLGSPSVVALGRESDAELHRQDVPHAVVPHPQYVRRFYQHQHEKYREVILQAAIEGGDFLSAFPQHIRKAAPAK